MTSDGYDFLEQLAEFPAHSFEHRFSKQSLRLGLASVLNGEALDLLCDAAFYATLCNIAFNGLGGCRGVIKPEHERTRRVLEREYMAARDRFYASKGWKNLPVLPRRSIQRAFLTVFVAGDNLAW